MRTHEHGLRERASGPVPREGRGGAAGDADAAGDPAAAGAASRPPPPGGNGPRLRGGPRRADRRIRRRAHTASSAKANDDRDVGNGGYEVFQRTATVEAFTVGSPSDWYLVNQWPMSMLIACRGERRVVLGLRRRSRRRESGVRGHPGNADHVLTDPDTARPADAPALEHRPRPRRERVRRRCSRERAPFSTWRSTTTLRSPASRIRRSRSSHPASASRRRETARAVPVDTRTSRSTASDSSRGSGSAPARATKTGKRSRPPTR